jgi:6,7-dimethyl-8-ribityllumazine synthase
VSTGGYRSPGPLDGRGLRIGIVCTRWNADTVAALLRGAHEGLAEHGVADGDIEVEYVPGAFEIPIAAEAMASSRRFDAVITLGAVVRGDTPHFEYVSGPCADGIMRAQLDTGVPVMFGVLTVNTQAQADERCAPGPTNKGREAAEGAVEMALLMRRLRAHELGD